MRSVACLACILGLGTVADGLVPEQSSETFHYLRLTANSRRTECKIHVARSAKGWSISSVTGAMLVETQYDVGDRLQTASAKLTKGAQTLLAQVTVAAGKGTIKQEKTTREFEVPPGVIVTSAPDWTDTFLLCRRYDRAKGGKQEFAGLWIHPEQTCYRATFSIERKGTDRITHDGKELDLDRFVIQLRPKSLYAAWADAQGHMIKLVPMPWQKGTYSIVREGYEKSAAALAPGE